MSFSFREPAMVSIKNFDIKLTKNCIKVSFVNFLWENVKFLHKMLLCSCNVDYWMVEEGHTMFANTRLSPSTKLLPPFINSDLLQVISASISDAIVVGVISF